MVVQDTEEAKKNYLNAYEHSIVGIVFYEYDVVPPLRCVDVPFPACTKTRPV